MPNTIKETADDILQRATVQVEKEDLGFATPKELNEYLHGREVLIEDMAKFIADVVATQDDHIGSEQELAGLKATIGELAKELKTMPKGNKELSKDQLCAELGAGIAAVWKDDFQNAGEKGFIPNKTVENDWLRYQKYVWGETNEKGEKGWTALKAVTGSPIFQDSGTTGTYVVNPIYETELIRAAVESSDMMDLVRTVPMFARTHYYPNLSANEFSGGWHTGLSALPAYADGGTPTFAARVELTAQTYAGYIPWFDEFEEDYSANIQLGQLFMEAFAAEWAQVFDKQCLTESANPFSGAMIESGFQTYRIPGDSPYNFDLETLTRAPLAITNRIERSKCMWFLNETFIAMLAAKRATTGEFLIWSPPIGDMPGKLGLYPYRECRQLPTLDSVVADTALGWFGNPDNIWHGDRKGLEVRRYEETSNALLNGELFVRFRKRSAFKVVKPAYGVVLKTRA